MKGFSSRSPLHEHLSGELRAAFYYLRKSKTWVSHRSASDCRGGVIRYILKSPELTIISKLRIRINKKSILQTFNVP